ncbi:MAG: DUF58 domain-containing protein [Anaerolineae bacterium]
MRRGERLIELRNALPFIIWVAALILAFNSGWVMAYRILYLFTILIVIGLVWSGGAVLSLSVEREPAARMLHVGDMLSERVTIRNRSILPQMWVAVDDDSDMPHHLLRQVLSYIGPRSSRQFLLRTVALRRGRYHLGPTVLTGGDPFGIFRTRRRIGSGASVVVYPRVYALESFGVLAGVLQADTRRMRRSSDPTTDVSSVREYRPGDEFRRIHWLSSARQGRLISKEFEHSPGGDVWIVLDMQGKAQAGSLLKLAPAGEFAPLDPAGWPEIEPATEEYAVSMAASVAAHFLRADRAVGFVSNEEAPYVSMPDRGERQLARILDRLAVARADGRLPLQRVLEREAHRFRRFDTVVTITPSDDEGWLYAAQNLALRGIRVLAVVVDRASFDERIGGGRLSQSVSAHGLPVCPIEKGQRPDEVLCEVA